MRTYFISTFFLFVILGFSQTDNYILKNASINTEYPHFGLMLNGDTKMLLTSYLLDKRDKVKRFQGNPILTIFEVELTGSGDLQNLKQIEIDPDEKITYITAAALSKNGKQLFVTTMLNENNISEDNFQIKIGKYNPEVGWTNFKTLPFCNPKYSYAHPSISEDGKWLYFTANIRGGKENTRGGSDIFMVQILGDNKFGPPKNLGSNVNSYSKEMFPFISADNTLYFASNRPNGFGGFDIYKSKRNKDGTFEKAEKLPEPINSNKDDFCFVIDSFNKSGFFSSKRDDGKGDDDIYAFIKN